MFSTGHILFILISVVLIAFGIVICRKKKPPMKNLLIACLILSLISEVIKFFSNIVIAPVVTPLVENGQLIYRETGAYAPYLEAEHLPFELCSLQILFILIALFLKKPILRKRLFMLMYTTCLIGGAMGILLSSAAIGLSDIREFLTSIDVWRAFLYHSTLVVLGCYIGISEECDIRFKDVKWAYITILSLDVLTMYVNSMMATPYYQGDSLVGIGNVINYFSSYNNPLGIPMRNRMEWIIYLLIRFTLAVILILLVNLPLLRKERHKNGK